MKLPHELKDLFLEMAEPLLKEYVDAALGHAKLSSTCTAARNEVWSLLKQLILASDTKIVLEGGTPEQVLKAVEKGVITMENASKLLQMYKQVKEYKHIGQTPGNINQGFQIVVAGMPAEAWTHYAEHQQIKDKEKALLQTATGAELEVEVTGCTLESSELPGSGDQDDTQPNDQDD